MTSMHTDSQTNEGFDDESYDCRNCQEGFLASGFDLVDDELNPRHPLCPACQVAARLESAECEQCGEPATHEVELGPLCDNCFEHYVDGYRENG